MGIWSWLFGSNNADYDDSEINQQEESAMSQLKRRFKVVIPKLDTKVDAPKVIMPTTGVKAQPNTSGHNGVAYPDGKGGWRLIWIRKDGSTSESFAPKRPAGFRYANNQAEAVAIASAAKGPAQSVRPEAKPEAKPPDVAVAVAVKEKPAAAEPVKPEVIKPVVMVAKSERQPFVLDRRQKLARSQGTRITPKMPRLR